MKTKFLLPCFDVLRKVLVGVLPLCLLAANAWSGVTIAPPAKGDNLFALKASDDPSPRTATAYQQTQPIVVAGRVTSGDDNESLPGVNVAIKGTTQGTVTDVNGQYTLEVPSRESEIGGQHDAERRSERSAHQQQECRQSFSV